jgi:deoxyribodipyrimidine photo-lyase
VDKTSINIIWFKRDLRLSDHQPLLRASEDSLPVLMIYFYELSVMSYADSDERHWRFVQQSIDELNKVLAGYGHRIHTIHGEALPSLKTIAKVFDVHTIFSHEEIGNHLTYQRDQSVAKFCKEKNIVWKEYPTNGIMRGLANRKLFSQKWMQTMSAPLYSVELKNLNCIQLPTHLLPPFTTSYIDNRSFQPGGISAANQYLTSFLYQRKSGYSKYISKPEESRKSCSRLSPYLAWGNLSMKQVYQATLEAIAKTGDKRNLGFFINRLHWHCHFIQKFESECRMEFENLNKGFDGIRSQINQAYIAAWEVGQTGYPLIDACVMCVKNTGYLNFRMRSLLVSFLTHHLWQPWQAGVHFLARQFLDYEPGIHYPQFQMQAGTMGVNTIRIYNPVKQSIDHDPDGLFIKKWLPSLEKIPVEWIHELWRMPPEEQASVGIEIGKDYPLPIVDIQQTARYARERLWQTKKSTAVQKENKAILKKHTKRKTEKESPLQLAIPNFITNSAASN